MWTVGEVGGSDCVRHSVASVTSDLHSGTDGDRHAENNAVLSSELVALGCCRLMAVLFLTFKNTDCCGLPVHRCSSVRMCCQKLLLMYWQAVRCQIIWPVGTVGQYTVLIL